MWRGQARRRRAFTRAVSGGQRPRCHQAHVLAINPKPDAVSGDNLGLLRKADIVDLDEIRKAHLYDAIWQGNTPIRNSELPNCRDEL